MTDRAPTEADLPVWVSDTKDGQVTFLAILPCHVWTHWRPAKDDMPEPPREETQADKDCAAYRLWMGNLRCKDEDLCWHAALAYERAEVAKMLPPPISESVWSMRDVYDAIESIRARCGGGGK